MVPFLEAGATVKGYDYDRRYLDYGNSRNPALNLCFGGLEDLKAEDKKYDLIIINHVLEHLSSPEATLEQVKGNLKPDGILYIGLPGLKKSSLLLQLFKELSRFSSYRTSLSFYKRIPS